MDSRTAVKPGAAGETESRGVPPEARGEGLILRQEEPLNLESRFAGLQGLVTRNDRFYVRNHFAVPVVEASAWRLRVEGAVERPVELSHAELLALPSRTETVTLECAGNGRAFLEPKKGGVQWEQGAVGTAEWTGVPLASVLERAGVRADAVEVVLEGADRGEIAEQPVSPGAIAYARSLPLEKALRGDVLLAYRMNGAELSREHGFPLRAVVPGWYGMASVKWLSRIIVTPRPFHGYFQTFDYSHWRRDDGLVSLGPVAELQLKAQIARPAAGERVPPDHLYTIRGAAWTGDGEVAAVEISMDGGRTWEKTRLLGVRLPYAWRLWECDWRTPSRPRRCSLMARAIDSHGRAQPLERDPDRRSYMVSHVVPVEVEVGPPER